MPSAWSCLLHREGHVLRRRVLPDERGGENSNDSGARGSRRCAISGSRDAKIRQEMPPDPAEPPPTIVALPYPVALRRHRCLPSAGGTHADELRHALDFSLPVGTPVLAAADGVVAAAVAHRFKGCAMQGRDARAAFYVALRHADGRYSRYYHLASVGVRCGERVRARAPWPQRQHRVHGGAAPPL